MHLLYTIALYLILPVVLLRLWVKSFRIPAYRQRWLERLGRYSMPRLAESVWIHSVSVGETQAAEPLIRKFLEDYPELPMVISTTTPTGSDRVKTLFGDAVDHVYFPYDIAPAVAGFLDHFRPKLLVMMETEIWPNLLSICDVRGIPTILANARMSAGSARGYARLGRFSQQAFERIGTVAVQSPADAERFLGLGALPSRVRVTGSIKFDIRLPASLHEQADVIRRQWGERPVWVAASTHEGEDEQILAAHQLILQQQPAALLVLVPRHPERFDRVANLCSNQGFNLARRSGGQVCTRDVSVFLGDTMGELTRFLAAADVAFVGGSLVPTGGHNVLEPAALGVPVVFGPHMFNFEVISRMLLAEHAAMEVADSHQLALVVNSWFDDVSERTQVGENGRRVVGANRGALERLWSLIEEVMASQVPGEADK